MQFPRHAIHPMLLHFPMAFWSSATACDGFVLLGSAQVSPFAWMLMALGSAAAVPAMIAGLVEFARLNSAAEADGQRHMMLMVLAWLLYAGALVTRFEAGVPLAIAPVVSVALSFAAFATLAARGWYGGQLVYRHRVGSVDSAAHQLSHYENQKVRLS